jgi:hypothetical protein
MKQKQIDTFFKILDKELSLTGEVILLGASAGSLMGHIRPSLDIDFEIRLQSRKTPKTRERLERAIAKASTIVGVATNYSEHVGGWSKINYLDYRKTAVFYKPIRKLKVKIIEPSYWTIGKMARFLELDIRDMVKIIRTKKIPPQRLIAIWARALRASDWSLELGQFRDHAIYFIQKYGKKIWGRRVDVEGLIKDFKKKI